MPNAVDYWMQGVAQGSDLMAQSARIQELRSQAAMRRLQERRAAQEMEMLTAENNRQIQFRADMKKAMDAATLASSPTIPVFGPTGPMGMAPNPNAMSRTDAAFKFVLPVIGAHAPEKIPAAMQDLAMAEYRERASRMMNDGEDVKVVVDPVTGKNITMTRSGPTTWSRLPESSLERQSRGFSNSQKLSVFKWALESAPHLMQQDENGMPFLPPENFQEAARLKNISGATKTDLQGTEIAGENVFAQGQKLLPLINDRTTGVRGGFQRLLTDSGLGVFFPKVVDPQVAEADAVARVFAAKVVRDLRSDGNITKGEYESLLNEANTLRWVDQRTGKARLKTFVEDAIRKARTASQKLGKPINEKYLTFDEIGKRAEAKAESGEMTAEEAMDWGLKTYAGSAAAFLEKIRSEIGE